MVNNGLPIFIINPALFDPKGEFLFPEKDLTIPQTQIPLPGFDNECDNEIMEILNTKLEKEQLTPRDFIIKQLSNLSLEGTQREAFME